MIQFDSYFSDGLKPPTSEVFQLAVKKHHENYEGFLVSQTQMLNVWYIDLYIYHKKWPNVGYMPHIECLGKQQFLHRKTPLRQPGKHETI